MNLRITTNQKNNDPGSTKLDFNINFFGGAEMASNITSEEADNRSMTKPKSQFLCEWDNNEAIYTESIDGTILNVQDNSWK